MLEEYRSHCIGNGTTVEAEMEKSKQEDRAKREAWNAKKLAMREAARG
jgi:hypothetical protein